MTLTDRDRKIVLAIVPVVVIVGAWFLVFAPKHAQVAKVQAQLAKAEKHRDAAEAKAGSVESAKADYAKDYETVVRLGKAIPSTVDMPSLIVQLSKAAKGTHIDFRKIKTGERTEAAVTPTPPATSSSGKSGSGSSGSTPPASGSSSAPPATGSSSAPPATGSSSAPPATGSSSAPPATGSSSAPPATGSSAAPPATGSAATSASGGGPTGSGVPGLDTVPLEFGFDGSFTDLASFFHRLKRFVHVANSNLEVQGRLMTIDSISFSGFPHLVGEVKGTVYLAPKAEGNTAGATSSGPAGSTPAAASSGAAPATTPTSGSSGGAAQ